jgi:DNA excision repair protein ERCC-2
MLLTPESLLSISLVKYPYRPTDTQSRILELSFMTKYRGIFSLIEAPNGVGKSTTIAVASAVLAEAGIRPAIFCSSYAQISRIIQELKRTDPLAKGAVLGGRSALCCSDGVRSPKVVCVVSRLRSKCTLASPEIGYHPWLMDRDELISYFSSLGICSYEAAWKGVLDSSIVIAPQSYLLNRFAWDRISRYLSSDFVFVDECHNLLNRGMNSFSFDLVFYSETCRSVERAIRSAKQVTKEKLLRSLRRYDDLMTELEREIEESVSQGQARASLLLEDHEKLKLIFEASYEVIVIKQGRCDAYMGMPEEDLRERLMHFDAGVLLSATPGPYQAYELMMSPTPLYYESLPSPYSKEKFLVLVETDFTTKYTERSVRDYNVVAERIDRLLPRLKGNMAAYFPSYEYMYRVLDMLLTINGYSILDTSGHCLLRNGASFIIMDVQGGKTSEGHEYPFGLDLVLVVGLGMPFPKLLLRKRRYSYSSRGFKFATHTTYLGWAVQKAVQAVGRVIRGPGDRGIGILMDRRFSSSKAVELMPQWFRECLVTGLNFAAVEEYILKFGLES